MYQEAAGDGGGRQGQILEACTASRPGAVDMEAKVEFGAERSPAEWRARLRVLDGSRMNESLNPGLALFLS